MENSARHAKTRSRSPFWVSDSPIEKKNSKLQWFHVDHHNNNNNNNNNNTNTHKKQNCTWTWHLRFERFTLVTQGFPFPFFFPGTFLKGSLIHILRGHFSVYRPTLEKTTGRPGLVGIRMTSLAKLGFQWLEIPSRSWTVRPWKVTKTQ